MEERHSDHDVTGEVKVSSPEAVCDAVHDLFVARWPHQDFRPVRQAFSDFEDLFTGRLPGYLGCDTIYHDMQHSLDMTLALARIMVGYEMSVAEVDRLGGEIACVALITALFHDAGYIRERDDDRVENGAEYTLVHVTRSGRFLRRYLASKGFGDLAEVAMRMVHYTGYEVDIDGIVLPDEKWHLAGHMIGTADLIAQMADRCYLEKCRDRLFPEFVLAGIAMQRLEDGSLNILYRSGQDLLLKTPIFYEKFASERLDTRFGRVYQHAAPQFDGSNPYMEALERNLGFARRVIEEDDWSLVRRHPPCFIVGGELTLRQARKLVADRLRELREDLRSAA